MPMENNNQAIQVAGPFATRLEHLDINLNGDDRAGVVTSVLQSCLRALPGEPLGAEDIQSWTLASRLQRLLAICRSSGIERLSLDCRCPGCHEDISLEPELQSFEMQVPACATVDVEPAAGPAVSLRLPTGVDQARWSRRGTLDPEQLLRELLVPGRDDGEANTPDQWTPAWRQQMEEALEQADPLTALEIGTRCPECNHEFEVAVDLEQALLTRLHREQQRVLAEIHQLASRYHWGEQEVLNLTPPRRAFYLGSIRREARS